MVGNTYRAADGPIVLRSTDAERAAHADPKSPLGFDTRNNGFSVKLRVEDDRLVGEDRWFTYAFEPGDAQPDARAADRNDGAPVDAAADESLGSTPAPESRAEARESAAAGTRAPARMSQANGPTPAANARAENRPTLTPPYPIAAGAYVLADGAWRPLPGKTVQTLKVAAAAARTVTGLLGKLNVLHDARAERQVDAAEDVLSNLTFNSPAPVPVAAAKSVVVVYVAGAGATPTRGADSTSRPAIEMAPAVTLPNGARTIPLVEIAPGLAGFGASRISATIEQPEPGKTVLRATAPMARGRYVVLCGGRGYEVGVE